MCINCQRTDHAYQSNQLTDKQKPSPIVFASFHVSSVVEVALLPLPSSQTKPLLTYYPHKNTCDTCHYKTKPKKSKVKKMKKERRETSGQNLKKMIQGKPVT